MGVAVHFGGKLVTTFLKIIASLEYFQSVSRVLLTSVCQKPHRTVALLRLVETSLPTRGLVKDAMAGGGPIPSPSHQTHLVQPAPYPVSQEQ
jgi:hypothetical protein